MFLQPDMSSYMPENSNHIQPQVVLLCEHNIIMRILNKIQLMIEFRVSFMQVTKREKMFLQTDTSSYVPENRKWIQPVVVFCCKHNIIMRIYTKIQLILESNLDFQGFINIDQTYSKTEVQPVVVLDTVLQDSMW